MVQAVQIYMKTEAPISHIDKSPLAGWSASLCRRKKMASELWILYQSIKLRGFIPRDNDKIGIRITRDGNYAFYGGTHRAAILMAMDHPVPVQVVKFCKEP